MVTAYRLEASCFRCRNSAKPNDWCTSSFPGTAQYAWPLLAARAGAEVWVKHENHTPTGVF